MFKKILAGTLLAGLIGILVIGGINRTMDKTSKVADQGRGRDRAGDVSSDRGGYGQGGARNGVNAREYPNYQAEPEEWTMYEGVVVQTPEVGEDLVIATENGQEVTIGTGPSYMAAQGLTLQIGEMVQVRGYWEAGEFKAAQVTRVIDGQTINLRDEIGRPAWAGGGRNSQVGQGVEKGSDYPYGSGQAEVDGWLQLQGTVVSADADALVFETTSGEEIILDGRPWRFAQEQSCSAQVGDQMTLTGFYEESDPATGVEQQFEVGRIENITNGQTILIRDENGRPLWAGRGRSGM